MKRLSIAGLILASVFALSAAVADAQPSWIVHSSAWECGLIPPASGLAGLFATKTTCEAMTPDAATTDGYSLLRLVLFIQLGTQTFSNGTQSVECSGLMSTGIIWNNGAGDGLDYSVISFTGCKVFKGKTATELNECTVETAGTSNPGTVTVSADTELVFLEDSTTGPIGDLFKPTSGTTFVKLNFTSTGSGSGKCKISGETSVVGNVVAKVLVGSGLEATGATAMEATQGILMFPTSAIKEYWTPGLTKEKAGLTVFGTETATQSGEVEGELLEGGEAFGVS
jgi:hypothetical protein